MRLNNLEQYTYDADRPQEPEEFAPVETPVVTPAAATPAPVAEAPKPTDAMLRGKEISQIQFDGMTPVYQSSGGSMRAGEPGELLGYRFENSQIQEPGMVAFYSAPVYRDTRGGQALVDPGGKFLGYNYLPENGIIKVPKPANILAIEKQLGGKELEPIYASETKTRGRGGASESIAYGPPIGYRYDNGQSQYVNYDASGEYQGTADRKHGLQGFEPLLAIAAAAFFGPMAFEALGLTGASAGAAGATAGAFLPTGTTAMVLSAPTTLSAWVASPFLATGSTISAVTGIAMTPEIAALLGQVVIETASNGGDAGLALKNAATSFGINLAAGQINNAISSVVNQAPTDVLSDSAKNAVSAGLTNATIAAAMGKDPLSALAAAGASYIAPNLLKQIPGYGDMPAELKRIGSAAIQASLLGKNPTEAALNTALQLGKQAITSYIDTTTGLSQKIKDLRSGIENSLTTGVKDLTQLATDSTKTQTEDKEQAAIDAKVFNANGMKLDTINDAAKAASAAGFTTFKYGDSTYNITGNFGTTPTVSTTTNAAGQNQITAGSPGASVTGAGPTEGQLALTNKLNDLAALSREGENISEGEKVAIRHQEERQQLKPGEAMFTVADTMTPGERNQLIESTIERATDFNEAYAAARAGYGAGKTFTWNGNSYSTSTRAEDPKLAAASDDIRMKRIETAITAGRGNVNDTGVRAGSTLDALTAYFGESTAKDDIAWRDAISKKILDGGYKGTDEKGLQIVRATNLTDHLIATGGVALGQQAQSFAGAWSTAFGTSYSNGFAEWGKYVEKWGKDRTGAEIQKEMDTVDKRIGEISKMNWMDQASAYAKLVKENPWAVGNYALIETVQEGVPVAAALTGAGLAIVAGAGTGTVLTVAALASATSDALEVFGGSGKSAYDEAFKQAMKSGASKEQADNYAHKKAVNVATADAAITLGTEFFADRVMLSSGLTALKSAVAATGSSLVVGSAQEFVEGFLQTLNQAQQIKGDLTKADVNNAFSQGLWGAIIAPGASTMVMGTGVVINGGVAVGKDLLGNSITFNDLKEGKKDIDYSSLNGNAVIATSDNGSKISLAGWTAAASSNAGLDISSFSSFMPSSLTDGSTAAVTLANGKEITVDNIEDVTGNNANITGTDFISDVSTMTPDQIVNTYTNEVLKGATQLDTATRNNVLSQSPAAVAKSNAKIATDAGFPSFDVYSQYGGNAGAYKAAQRDAANLLTAQSAGFPDFASYTQFNGDLTAYDKANNDAANIRRAADAGFPDYATFLQYEGKIADYSAAKAAETNRLTATNAGFPDYATYTQYGGNKAVYDTALSDVANTKLATEAGFPSYGSYTNFNGDIAAYNAAKAAAEKALAIATKREDLDLRYDVNKDGKITSADALSLSKGTPVRSDIDASGAVVGGAQTETQAGTGTQTGTVAQTGAGTQTGTETQTGTGTQTGTQTGSTAGATTDATAGAATGATTSGVTTGGAATGATTGATTTGAATTGAATTGSTTGATTGATTDTTTGAATGSTTGATTGATTDATTGAATGTTTGTTTGATTDTNTGVTSGAVTNNAVTADTLTTALGGVTADVKTKFDTLTQGQKDIVSAQVQQGVDLNQAIDDAAKTTTEQIANVKTDLTTNITNVQTQFNTRVDELVLQGKTYQEATQEALKELGTGITDLQSGVIDIKEKAKQAEKVQTAKNTQSKVKSGLSNAMSLIGGAALGSELVDNSTPGFKDIGYKNIGDTKFESILSPFQQMVEKNVYAPKLQQQNEPQTQQQPQQVAPVNQDLETQKDQQQGSDYFSYGSSNEIDQMLGSNPGTQMLYSKAGGLATPLMAGGGTTRHGRYAGGGLNVIEHSGKARLDFRTGNAVTGPGDGQSDDIPAMLADGEFVFPADVVAALGNGSTKAGSDKLYDMMHSIRAYHRSAKPKDLPPPAKKSPLDYLKKTARKARR